MGLPAIGPLGKAGPDGAGIIGVREVMGELGGDS